MSFYRPHQRVTATTSDQLVTKQAFKKECDINNILKQYKRTGIINHIAKSTARYETLPSGLDYQASLNIILEAEQAFSQLPSKVRDKYMNDPQAFLLALERPENRADFEALGILKPGRTTELADKITPPLSSSPPPTGG